MSNFTPHDEDPHLSARTELNGIRTGMIMDAQTGKSRRIPQHLTNQKIMQLLLKHLESRGEFFTSDGHPYYFDHWEHKLVNLSPGARSFSDLLIALGLLPKETDTRMVEATLHQMSLGAPNMPVHRLAYMPPTKDAVYIRASESRMIKVTADATTEVPLGSDGVLLLAEDLGDWPTLADIQPHIDRLRPLVGNACTRFIPDSPLGLITSRWGESQFLSSEQQRQVAFSRLMFIFCATRSRTWPILLLTGEGGSGKSTLMELFKTMLLGRDAYLDNLPGDKRSIIAKATASTFAAFDNIDEVGLDKPKNAETANLVCQMSTGAEVHQAMLFRNNELATYVLKLHCFFSACLRPYDRSDVLRRTLELSMAPADPNDTTDKQDLLDRVTLNRNYMLAEVLLRVQNMVRAHARTSKIPCISKMPEYETFTYLCSEFEGTTESTQELWRSIKRRYSTSNSEFSPLVLAVRLWLGKDNKNVGREIGVSALYLEMEAIYKTEIYQPFPYRAINSFGRQLQDKQSALQILGYVSGRKSEGSVAVFNPSPDELSRCEREYKDMKRSASIPPHILSASHQRFLERDAARQQTDDDAMLAALDDFDDAPKKETVN